MKRYAVLPVLAVLLAGCRAPMPSFNPFAPYGPSRVPPPPTGSYNATSPYYQRPSQPSAAPPAGLGQRATIPWKPIGAATDEATDEDSVEVRLASGEQRERISASSKSSTPFNARLQGMPVNDATKPAEPKLLKTPDEDPIEISDLPGPPPATSSPTLGRSAAAYHRGALGPSRAIADASGWRSRYSLTRFGG